MRIPFPFRFSPNKPYEICVYWSVLFTVTVDAAGMCGTIVSSWHNVLFCVPNWNGVETIPNRHKSLTDVATVTKGGQGLVNEQLQIFLPFILKL